MSDFPGIPATQERPAGFFVRKSPARPGTGGWHRLDFRTADWFGDCAHLGGEGSGIAASDAIARGEAKRLEIRLRTSNAGDEVRVAERADEPSPGNWISCDTSAPVVRSDWGNRPGVTSVWLWAVNGTERVEIELWFDIPPTTGPAAG